MKAVLPSLRSLTDFVCVTLKIIKDLKKEKNNGGDKK